MSAKIIPLYKQQQLYSGSYEFTATNEPDLDFRKYLARQLRDVSPPMEESPPADATPLDISLDDVEGDVVAGISAWTAHDVVTVDLLWVGTPLRGQGIGRRLLQMVEEEAARRGCVRARVCVTTNVAFLVGAGYVITGTVQTLSFRNGGAPTPVGTPVQAIYWLEKEF